MSAAQKKNTPQPSAAQFVAQNEARGGMAGHGGASPVARSKPSGEADKKSNGETEAERRKRIQKKMGFTDSDMKTIYGD